MASLQQLSDDVISYLNRRDALDRMASWVTLVETQIAETCRTRAQLVSGDQLLDSAFIALPADFATMESICDYTTGKELELTDAWSRGYFAEYSGQDPPQTNPTAPVTAYRIKADCIEFLPHPFIPDPPDPAYVFQKITMGYYQKPRPLLLPADTNPVLERHYSIYLWGILKEAALWALDDDRAAQADAQFQQHVTRANLWIQQSNYSGAPLRNELANAF